jgi:hypothetical protein
MPATSPALRDAQAARRFDALPHAAQMALVRELVDTRARELKLAYRSVTLVTAGFRSQRDAQEATQLHAQACVILGVDRKWVDDGSAAEPADQRIPRRLLAYGNHKGRRVLYAVPTDVQPQRWYHGAHARAASAIRVEADDPQYTSNGTMACVARVRIGGTTKGFGLSAMHVLSPAPELDLPAPSSGAPFTVVGSAGVDGASAPWGGQLCSGTLSFDAQMADISSGSWLGAAFAGLTLSATRPHIRSREEFDALAAKNRFLILAPDNHASHQGAPRGAMVAQFRSYLPHDVPIDYKCRVAGMFTVMSLTHAELVMLEVTEDSPAPEAGDSGAAVITWRPDGSLMLAGMFIASKDGDESRTTFMLPSWQLMDTGNWRTLPPGTTRITPSFSMP